MSLDPDVEIAVVVEPATIHTVLAGAVGPPGPVGPTGGELISGYWDYDFQTTPPPASGHIRTSPDPIVVGQPMTIYLAARDDQGLAWSAVGVKAGDDLRLRGTGGAVQHCEVTSFDITVPGIDGYATIQGIAASVQGQIAKNAKVEVALIRPPAPGPPGPPGPEGPSGPTGPQGEQGMPPSNVVVGPASAPDNTVPRFDGATGKQVQDSPLTVQDDGKLAVKSGANTVLEYGTNGTSSTGGLAIRAMPPHGQQITMTPRSDVNGAAVISSGAGVYFDNAVNIGNGSVSNTVGLSNQASGTTRALKVGTGLVNLPHLAVPPTAPNNGDMWTQADGLYVRVNGVTLKVQTA